MSARVIVALRVAATPTRAFEVFTREIGVWWQPNPAFAFTRGAAGRLALEPGKGGRFIETKANGQVFEIGRVTAWEPGLRLALTWRQESFAPDQVTEVEIRFEAVGEETRVTVDHSGWETIPQDHKARHRFPAPVFMQRHGTWWQVLLASFSGHIR